MLEQLRQFFYRHRSVDRHTDHGVSAEAHGMRSDTTLNPELKPELKPEPKPETATQQLQLGHHCFDQGQFDQAIVHYRHALFADPTQTEIYQYLAEALSQVGDLAEAAACYRQAIDLTASSAAELTQLPAESPQEQQSQSQTAVGLSDRVLHPHQIRLSPEQRPDDAQSGNGSVNCLLHGKGNSKGAIIAHETELYLTQAENAYKQEKWQDTVTYCHHLLQSQPNVSAYKLLGNALQRLGQFSEAVDAYLSAIQLAPQAADIYANLGSLYAQQQRWQDAVVYYQSAIAINPDFAGVYRNLARVWVQLAQSDKAMECWYRAFKLEPEKVSAEEQINLGNWLLGQNRIEAAIDSYRHAIQLAPTLAAGYQNLAAALTRQGKTQEAAPFYRKAQELGLDIPAVSLSSQAAGATAIPSVSTNSKRMAEDGIAASHSFNGNGNGIYSSNSNGNSNGNGDRQHLSIPSALTPPSRLGRAETQLATAADYFEQEQWDEAIVASAEALQQLEPELVQTYRHLADAFYAKKQLTEAIRYARRVVELEPNSAADRVNLGSLYAQQEEWQAALDCYQTAIALDANLASAHWNLAKVWEVIDRPEQATTAFFQALALEPNWASLSEHLTLAHTLRSQSQQDSALACYQQVIQRDATCAEAYAALAEMFAQQQQWQNSVTHYQQAIQHDPKNLNYLVSFGQVLAAVQQWQAAITVYRQVIRLDPQPAHYLTLAQFLERQEQWDEAIECYQTLVRLQPRWEVAHKLGDLLNRQQRWPEAVIAFRQAIELNPDYSWSHNNLGDALIHMEQWQEAAAVFRQAIELHPDFHWSHYNLGEALAKLEQWDGAIVAYRRALELQPETSAICEKLADVLYERAKTDKEAALGLYHEAIEQDPKSLQNYHKFLEIQPRNAEIHLKLSSALTELGEKEQAAVFSEIAKSLLESKTNSLQSQRHLEQVSSTSFAKIKLEGRLDLVNSKGITGWIWNKNSPNDQLIVEILEEEKVIDRCKADQFREDLKKAGKGEGTYAFRVPLPSTLLDGKEHKISARIVGTDYYLSGSPIKFIHNVEQPYHNFEQYLQWSMLNREIETPFHESDERILGYMDWYAGYLKENYVKLEQQTKVSIVMPVHNRDAVVQLAINSVLEQSYQNWELVVVDDGSSDQTVQIVENFLDPRIILHCLTKNGGVSQARNIGLSLCSGDYIAYLDSDNTWHPDFLLLMVNFIKENPEAESIYCAQKRTRVCSSKIQEEPKPHSILFGPFNRSLLENRNYIDINSFMHNRSVYEREGGFNENMRRLVDWDFILRYTSKQYPISLPCVLSYYFFGAANNQITQIENFNYAEEQIAKNLSERSFSFSLKDLKAQNSEIVVDYTFFANAHIKSCSQNQRFVSIVIPSYEVPEYLKYCVRSIYKFTPGDRYEVIVVDNASSSQTLEVLHELQTEYGIRIIYNSENMGFTYAVNQGIQAAKSDSDVVLLNNDALVTPGWLEGMLEVADEAEDVGIIVPRQVLIPGTKTMRVHSPFCNPNREIDVSLSTHHANILNPSFNPHKGYVELSFAPFFCAYITRECLKKVGLLDAKNGRHYRSDRLYCDAARNIGNLKIVYTPRAKLYHFLQQATLHLELSNKEFHKTMFVENTWDDLQQRTFKFDTKNR